MKLRLIIIILVVVILTGVGYIVIKHFSHNKSTQGSQFDRSRIRIEIINCSGINKQGMRTRDFLRSIGFDVYEIHSGKRTIDKTTIVERIAPDLKNALAVSNAMTFYKKTKLIPFKTKKVVPEIQKDLDSLLYLEVTVVLGKDCEKFLPKTKSIY